MIAGLLLAAGGARRFGTQKLVASLRGTPLVRRSATTLSEAVDVLVVVVGHDADAVRGALADLRPTVVTNDVWSEGLGGSLRAGIAAVPRGADAVVIALGDQPLPYASSIRELIVRWEETRVPIVAARYAGVRGHPVLFARSMFAELQTVTGDSGARGVIDRDPTRVAFVDLAGPMPADVDTVDDLARLNQGIDAGP